jgi:hypothetical protein
VIDTKAEGIENINDINKVINILTKMYELITKENQYIRDNDSEKISSTQSLKLPLMNWLSAFERYVVEIDVNFFKNLDKKKYNEFNNIYTKFQEALAINNDELQKTLQIKERIATVANEYMGEQSSFSTYNKGLASLKNTTNNKNTVPLMVNCKA